MKIKSQLNLIIISTIVVLISSISLSLWLKTRTEKISQQDEVIRELNLYFSNSNQIRDEYLIFKSERAKQQWLVITKKIDAQLTSVQMMFGEHDNKDSLDSIINLRNNIVIFFNQLIEYDKNLLNQGAPSEIRELYITQMIGQSHLLFLECSKLSRLLNRKSDEHALYYSIISTIAFVLLGLVIIIFSVLIKRRVTRPLTLLKEGTKIIAGGNFNYTLAVASSDEIGELACDFNRMTEQLATITVSRDELSREIEKRKHLETNLILREQALADSERFLKAIIDTEPECIKMLDIDCNLLMMNPAGLEMIQADSFDQVKGQCVSPFITEPYRDDYIALTKQAFQGFSGSLEFELVGLKGRHLWLETHAVPFRNEKEEIVALLGVTRDVTERKRLEAERVELEQQFQQTQKLESLGVLAGGIAHDFNNILAIIIGNCSLAKMDEENALNYVPEIEKATERAAELCRQMLAYAGKAQFVQAKVNFGSLVAETVNMLKKTVPQNAEIKFDCSTDIPFIQGDTGQLSQIVMNLIINASEAIGKEQGEIHVSLAATEMHEDHPERDYNGKDIPPGRYVCLEVTDNGCGMNEETTWRIFEPFYTTKFTGRGLGMSAALGIITSHKGALQLQSQLGHGTTFKVYLPARQNDSEDDEPVKKDSQTLWKGSGTILLVEDEEQVRQIAKTLLTKFGFSVVEAVNGKEALELYQKQAEKITLVLTDMGMPVMDGYALFHALKQLKPTLPIIVSSGFGDADVTSRLGDDDIAGLISKPYSADKLRELLKGVMEGTPPTQVK